MTTLERLLIDLLLRAVDVEQLNAILGDPQTTALLTGALVAFAAALPGAFLLLRKLAMTTDAISHTVLLGIVLAFLLLAAIPGLEADLNSPWLILGAALAGVATVLLTGAIQRSGLVRADAALGLVFPLLFAIAIILISRLTEDVHLDVDAVILGEIGVVWADARSHCRQNCDPVEITPDDPRAETARRCSNCAALDIGPRDPAAEFEEYCLNCGSYTAAGAWRARLVTQAPVLVFWPRAITAMLLTALLNLGFIALFFKELKLTTFDPALAASLGLRPAAMNTALMVLVSITAVAAFDAVGSVLVVAFFIIPPATAWLLSDRLAHILLLAPAGGILASLTGYELSRGNFLGIAQMSDLLVWLDGLIGLDGFTAWNTSISASIVLMMFFFFLLAWVFSPRQGLLLTLLQRRARQQHFADQLLLGHVHHHQGTAEAASELAQAGLHRHLGWTPRRTQRVLARLRLRDLLRSEGGTLHLTARGERSVRRFMALRGAGVLGSGQS